MWGDVVGVHGADGEELCAGPEVLANEIGARDGWVSHNYGGNSEAYCRRALVEGAEETIAVGEGLGQDVSGGGLAEKSGLGTKGILANFKQVSVGNLGDLIVSQIGNIGADDQMSGERAPQSKVEFLLI